MADGRPFLSVVIPAYNEALRLPRTIPLVMDFLSTQGYTYEVLVVDDGSTDGTMEIVRSLQTAYPKLGLLPTLHRGKAYAVREGVLAAGGSRILMTDADLSAPIAQASRLLSCMEEGYDVVIGSREGPGARRHNEPIYRHLMGRVFNLAVRQITGSPFMDTQCGFKLFRGDAACEIFSSLRLYTGTARPISGPMVTGLDVEVLQVARRRGYRVCEVGVEWHYRAGSKVRPVLDTYRMFKDVVQVRLNDLGGRYS